MVNWGMSAKTFGTFRSHSGQTPGRGDGQFQNFSRYHLVLAPFCSRPVTETMIELILFEKGVDNGAHRVREIRAHAGPRAAAGRERERQ